MPSPLSSPLSSSSSPSPLSLAAAAQAAGRRRCQIAAEMAPARPVIIAVSKTRPPSCLLALLQQGWRVFGENRVQEAAEKWPVLLARFPDIKLHMIGRLQSNKAEAALGLFSAIHTLDRLRLAEALLKAVRKTGRPMPMLFVQINTGREPQKSGIAPEETGAFLARLRALDLAPKGLMVLPPRNGDPARHFALLAELAAQHGLSALSMGMSEDYRAAARCGATHVRIGRSLFAPFAALSPAAGE